jgi:hypothetical protein
LIGWCEGTTNHLLSAFPKAGVLGWLSPWFGGLMPMLLPPRSEQEFPGTLYRETFDSDPVKVPDASGLPWQGIRLSADLERDLFRGLRIEIDLLTLCQSQALKVILRLMNQSTAVRQVDLGWMSFWQPDGTYQHSALAAKGVKRQHSPLTAWPHGGNWGAVTNAATGRTIIAVSPFPEIDLMDWGADGGHLQWIAEQQVPAESTLEREMYLVLADSLEEAKAYRHLAQYSRTAVIP